MNRYISFALFFLLGFTLNARDLKTMDGKIYLDIKVFDVKPHGIDIIHSKGAAFVRFDKLSKDLQKEFAYNPIKADEYEHKIELEKQKREKELALKRQQKEEREKEEARKSSELFKGSIDKIKAKVYSEGVPVKLNRKVLFKLYSGDPIFASTKLLGNSDVFPAYGKYMIANKKVYLVKNNVIILPDKLEKIKAEIVKLEEIVDELQDIVLKCDQEIDDNIKRIREILGITRINRSDFYDEEGNYIGTVEITGGLTDPQIDLVRALHAENRELLKKIAGAEKDIGQLDSKLEALKEEKLILTKEIDAFNASQKKFLKNLAMKTMADENKKAPEDIELKLKKLKEMHDRGLIPKDVYDEKVGDLIDMKE